MGKFLNLYSFYSGIKDVYDVIITEETLIVMKILLMCRYSHLQVFYDVRVLKNFAIFTGKYQRRRLFLVNHRRGPQVCNFIKKDSSTSARFQYFEEHYFYKTDVDDSFWIYQNINGQKRSMSQKLQRGGKNRAK